MNKHDYDNLQFLLNADAQQMALWFASVSQDDIDYALELLQTHKVELMLREMELMDDVEDVSEASGVLAGIMAK